MNLGTPPHHVDKLRHQITRCGPTLLMKITADFETIDRHRCFRCEFDTLGRNFQSH